MKGLRKMPTDAELEGRELSRWESDGGRLDGARSVSQGTTEAKPVPAKEQRYGKGPGGRILVNLASDGGWFSLAITGLILAGILALLIF
jgi:hypothetical protein